MNWLKKNKEEELIDTEELLERKKKEDQEKHNTWYCEELMKQASRRREGEAYLEDSIRMGINNHRINKNPYNFIALCGNKDGFYTFVFIEGEIAFKAKIEDLYDIINNNINVHLLDGLDKFNNCVTSYLDYHGRK